MSHPTRGIITFVLLVFAFSLGPYALVIHAQHLAVGRGLVVGVLMWMPAAAAFVTCRILKIDFASLGWSWRPSRFVFYGYILPLLYAIPVYLLSWFFIPRSFALSAFMQSQATAYAFAGNPRFAMFLLAIPIFATFGVITSLTSALGEEIGWRGFLLPRLTAKFGIGGGCLLSGGIWAVWHFPLLLFADYNSGTPKPFALGCFTVMVIGVGFQMAWLRLQSGSLWPCAMLHASHNLFIQQILDALTAPTGKALYVTTEFGVGLAITCGITAYLLWRRAAGSYGNFRPPLMRPT